MKIERLLAITVLLLNRRRVTAGELADRFQVSVRTIYRDLETLNGASIPIVACQGHGGGFCIPDNYKLSRQLLTFDDMVSILTTLNGVNRTLGNEDIARVIEKIAALIPEEKEPLYRTCSDSFIVDITPWGMSGRLRESVQTVHDAVSSSLLLSFDYTTAEGGRSRRTVEPHTLISKNFIWYVLGFCRLREDFRLFRLSRIRDLSPSQEHFLRRVVDPYSFISDADDQPLVQLVLKFHAEIRVKVEEYFPEQQLRVEPDGTLIATITLPETDWIVSFLLGFGDMVEVLSPPLWREKIWGKCTRMQKIYSNMT